MTVYRNVASLILAVMLLQAASGILSVSTPLALNYMGASSLGVGMVAAVFSAGFMLGAWFAPDIVRQIGHIRAYSAAAAIYAAGILSMALAFDPVAWGIFRLFQGAASADDVHVGGKLDRRFDAPLEARRRDGPLPADAEDRAVLRPAADRRTRGG
jgi:MFS family permease